LQGARKKEKEREKEKGRKEGKGREASQSEWWNGSREHAGRSRETSLLKLEPGKKKGGEKGES